MDTAQLWQAVLGELEVLISKANFTTWFKNTFILTHSDRETVVGVPNAFTKAWLEKKYTEQIIRALTNLTGLQSVVVVYRVAAKTNEVLSTIAMSLIRSLSGPGTNLRMPLPGQW